MLFMTCEIREGLANGMLWIRKWTWSQSTPVSTKYKLLYLYFDFQVSFLNYLFNASTLRKINLRYFAGQTRWYIKNETLCNLLMYSDVPISYHQKPPRSKLQGNLIHYKNTGLKNNIKIGLFFYFNKLFIKN